MNVMFYFGRYWYCFTDDEIGPYSFRQIVQKYAEGELRRGDLVRKSNSEVWLAIEEVPELNSAIQRYRRRKRGFFCRKLSEVLTGWKRPTR